MKKVFLFVMALCCSAAMFAGGGIFEAWMTYAVNDDAIAATQVKEDVVALNKVSKLNIDSFFVKVWQEGGENFDPVQVGYKLDNGDVQELQLEWKRDLSDKDREWAGELKKDFAAGLADGDHSLEMWFHGTLHNGENAQEVYMNNDGKNYKFNFTIGEATEEEEEEEEKTVEWFVKGSFNDWADGYKLTGEADNALSVKIEVEADKLYEFKLIKVETQGEKKDTTWFGLSSEGNIMKYDACTDWIAYKSEGEFNQANVGLQSTKAGEYTFTVDVTNKVEENIAPKFSVNIPEPEPVVIDVDWFVKGSFNEWADGYKLEGEADNALSVKIEVEADKLYEFKLIKVETQGEKKDTTWFGLSSEGNIMKYDACTDWIAYKSEGEFNQANVGLQSTKAGEYTFTVDVTNLDGENIAPKFSVNIPEPDPVVIDVDWFVKGSFNDWAEGYKLTGEADNALSVKIEVEADKLYEFKLIKVETQGEKKDTTWFGLSSEGNIMKHDACTDWIAYKSEGEFNQANVGLQSTKAGEYTFTVDVTNKVEENIAPKFSVNIPEPEQVVIDVDWFVKGTFNDWAEGYKLTGEADNALSVKIEVEADKLYEFKLIKVETQGEKKDTTWFGLSSEGNVMKYDACTDWIAYKSEGEFNQANVGLQSTKAGEYTFTVDVTNLDGENIAPKFSVNIPEPEPVVIDVDWFVKGSFNDWADGYKLTGEADNALSVKIEVEADKLYEFKLIKVETQGEKKDTTWFGLSSEGNVMKHDACTDWIAYKSEGEFNQANVGLQSTKAGEYTFTVDVTNKVEENIAPKFSVNIPEPEPVVIDVDWFVKGTFNDWAEGYKLTGEADDALSVKIEVEADKLYEFKLIKVETQGEKKDTTWFGLSSEGNIMKYDACTDWIAYKSEGEFNQANVGLQSTKAGEYTFTVDVTNLDGENIAPKFSVNIPEPEPVVVESYLQLKSQEWNKIAFVETEVQDSLVAKVNYEAAQEDELIILADKLYKVPAGGDHLNRDNSIYWWRLQEDAEGTSNIFLDIDVAGEYTFIWKAASHELKVIFPDKPEPVISWFIMGSFNEWADGYKLEGDDETALSVKITLAADADYEFKLLRLEDNEATWFGLPEAGNVMTKESCTDWFAYRTIADQEINAANVGLLTSEAGEYQFVVDVTNLAGEEIAPKFSVIFPQSLGSENIIIEFDEVQPMYNIFGMKVDANYHGIIIQNGHKYIR